MATAATTLQAFLFTDLVGSTELKRVLGDDEGARAIARHDELFRACLAEFGGVEQNNPGDGFFATFTVPSSAVHCALAFQRGLRDLDGAPALEARVGIHVGESSLVPGAAGQPDKLLGLAVDIAGRVMSLARPGQILLTRHVFDSARQHLRGLGNETLGWRAHGPYLLKGIDEPLEIFETGIEGSAPLEAPEDSPKARRTIRPGDEETLGWRPASGLDVPGRRDWVLEKKLGAGGFGEIWLAHNARTKEGRAFKFCFEADRLRSLKRELTLFRLIKQTLGDRPDITRLYEVQFDRPPFFLELEYTEDGSLDQWLAGQGGASSVALDTRIEFVAQAADALAAAHSVGVIHKDVKPSNVLVSRGADGTPHAALTDFGIGRLTDRAILDRAGVTGEGFEGEPTLMTDMASRTGTRLYMAPELLSGRPATIASDIYSLGVMLYQLIVGDLERPIAQGWENEVDDEILREDIAECVAGAPDARVRSADLLADRLRRRGERAREREEARRQQLREVNRRRALRIALLASAMLLVVAATSVIGYLRAEAQRRRAEHAEERATERFSEVRGLANAVLFRFDDQLRDLPGSLSARRLLVEEALRYLDNLPGGEAGDDLELALERARGYLKVAGVQGLPGRPNLGDQDGALENLSKALSILEALPDRGQDSRAVQTMIATVLLERGALLTTHDLDDSRNADLDRAQQMLEALAASDPVDRTVQVALAQVCAARAVWTYSVDGDPEVLRGLFERAIAIYRKLADAAPLDRDASLGLALTHSNYATSFRRMGASPESLAQALEQYGNERAILSGLTTGAPSDFAVTLSLVRNMTRTGATCYYLRKLDEALDWYDRARKSANRLVVLHPSDIRTRRFLGQICRGAAQVHKRNQEPARALEEYQRGVAVLTDLPAGTAIPTEIIRERAILHESAAGMHLLLDDEDAARREFELAVADFEAEFDPGGEDLFRRVFYPLACARVAARLVDMGDEKLALAYWQRMDKAFAEGERLRPDDRHLHVRAAQSRRAYADLNRERGGDESLPLGARRQALDDAIAMYRGILDTIERFPADPSDSRSAHMGAGGTGSSNPRAELRKLVEECTALRGSLEEGK